MSPAAHCCGMYSMGCLVPPPLTLQTNWIHVLHMGKEHLEIALLVCWDLSGCALVMVNLPVW